MKMDRMELRKSDLSMVARFFLIKFTKTGENTCTKLPLNYQNGPEI
jgi:hypothetical protein